jgi:phage shock protein C
MYCQHCGKGLSPESHFCSNCGAAVSGAAQPVNQGQAAARILRPRHPRAVAGVCAGFAQHFGWDLTLVRVLTAVFTILTSGLGVLVYAGLWILLPDAPYELSPGQSRQGTAA